MLSRGPPLGPRGVRWHAVLPRGGPFRAVLPLLVLLGAPRRGHQPASTVSTNTSGFRRACLPRPICTDHGQHRSARDQTGAPVAIGSVHRRFRHGGCFTYDAEVPPPTPIELGRGSDSSARTQAHRGLEGRFGLRSDETQKQGQHRRTVRSSSHGRLRHAWTRKMRTDYSGSATSEAPGSAPERRDAEGGSETNTPHRRTRPGESEDGEVAGRGDRRHLPRRPERPRPIPNAAKRPLVGRRGPSERARSGATTGPYGPSTTSHQPRNRGG